MKGLIIYSAEDVGKNSFFINKLSGILSEAGHDTQLVVLRDRYDHSYKTCVDDIGFVINRSRYHEVSYFYEKRGNICFNCSETVRICNDKELTYKLCDKLGLPYLKYTDKPDFFPCVVKSTDGHGGKEVFLAQNKNDIKDIAVNGKDKKFIFQQIADTPGTDVRLYFLGGKCIAGVKRTSDKDFRSNFSLGGKAEIFTPDSKMLLCGDELVKYLRADYIGIDFLYDNGRWVVNEAEDAVGARMLYSVSDIDIVGLFGEYIAAKLGQ